MEDLTGRTFNRWTVIKQGLTRKTSNNKNIRYWECRCECGTVREVREQSLLNGLSKSCGCYHREIMHSMKDKINLTHGLSDSRLYRIYHHMQSRCYNQNDTRYKQYGGRGIKIDEEWNTFESFSKWAIENGYNDDLSIDRVDVDGNYSPSNCRWVNSKIQSNNKTNNKYLTYNGETHTISEWADIVNIPYKKLWKRIHNGWNIEKSLTT